MNGQSTSINENTPLTTSSTAESSKRSGRRLLTYEESLRLVPWQTDNEYILTGYRPHLHSIKACLWSAVAYIHNETVNIHTHSIGAIIFLALIPLHLLPTSFPSLSPFLPLPHPPYLYASSSSSSSSSSSHSSSDSQSNWSSIFFKSQMGVDPLPQPPTTHDRIALVAYLICAVSCLSLSSWFHTVQSCSRQVCALAHSGDYIGIVILIVGSILPGMYYCFYDEPILQITYMTLIASMGLAATWMVLSPYGRTHRWHRTLTFIALGLSSVLPIGHIGLTKGFGWAREKSSLDLVVGSGASYIVGALLYAARCPEKQFPGKLDYIGNSHQIFHCFVLLGAWLQYAALRGMVWGRSMATGQA